MWICKFQENLEMHFNQNVFQGRPPTSSVYYRVLCLAQLFVFQSSFIPKGIKWKEPPHMRGWVWATLATLHLLPSSRHSHSFLGTQCLLSQTTALGRGDTTYLCQRWANSPNWQSITFPWPQWLVQYEALLGLLTHWTQTWKEGWSCCSYFAL